MKYSNTKIMYIIVLYALIPVSFFSITSSSHAEDSFPSKWLKFKWGVSAGIFKHNMSDFKNFGRWKYQPHDGYVRYSREASLHSHPTMLLYDFYFDKTVYPDASYWLYKSSYKLHVLGYLINSYQNTTKQEKLYNRIQSVLTSKYGKPQYFIKSDNGFINDKRVDIPRYWGKKLKRISVWKLENGVEMHHYMEYYYYAYAYFIKFYSPKFKELEAFWVKSIDDIM